MQEQKLSREREWRWIADFGIEALGNAIRGLLQCLRVYELNGRASVRVERPGEAVAAWRKGSGGCFPLCVGNPGLFARCDIEQGDVIEAAFFVRADEESLAVRRDA